MKLHFVPGEVALSGYQIVESLLEYPSFLLSLNRLKNNEATKDDIMFMVSPGVIDSIIYHERLLVTEPLTDFLREICDEFEKIGITRRVSLPEDALKPIHPDIIRKVFFDIRFRFYFTMFNPDLFSKYLRKNNLYVKKPLEDWASYFGSIDAKNFCDRVSAETPFCNKKRFSKAMWCLKGDLMSSISNLGIKLPTTHYDLEWPPYSCLYTVCREILNFHSQMALNHIIKSLETTRQNLTEEVPFLRIYSNCIEVPLTLSLVLQRIKNTKISASELYDGIIGLRKDRSCSSFRKYLQRFEIAIAEGNRDRILKSEAQLRYVAKEIRDEYLNLKFMQSRDWTIVSDLLLNLIWGNYKKVVNSLVQKVTKSIPAIRKKLGSDSHIHYMTNLGKAGIKSGRLKDVMILRFNKIGKAISEEYLAHSLFLQKTYEMLAYAKATSLPKRQFLPFARAFESWKEY